MILDALILNHTAHSMHSNSRLTRYRHRNNENACTAATHDGNDAATPARSTCRRRHGEPVAASSTSTTSSAATTAPKHRTTLHVPLIKQWSQIATPRKPDQKIKLAEEFPAEKERQPPYLHSTTHRNPKLAVDDSCY